MTKLSKCNDSYLELAAAQAQMPPPLCLPHCVQTRARGADGTPTAADIEAAVALMTPYFSSGNYPEVRTALL